MEEFLIERLGHQGDGIAAGPVFVPRALPGERVTGTRDGSVLRDVKIVEPSENRVKPLCRHYKSCGGCKLQHAADDVVSDLKVDIVRTALAAHGIETDFRDVHISPPQSRRRASFALRRTKKGALWGFHAQASDAPPAGAFLQATAHGEAALVHAVCAAASGARGIDLFAGCGTFTLPLAERFEMQGVEGDGAMVRALDQGWRRAQGLKAVESVTRDLFRRPMLPDELNRFDFAVLDPPRAGAEAQVAELAASALDCVIYVSCNPVTFARDASVLVNAGFSLEWVQVVDQFRWSAHVELAARFVRPHMQR